MAESTVQLGTQDPELRNSPIVWESDEDIEAPREAVPDQSVCYFNSTAYPHGTLARSGTALLRCEGGYWVPAGSGDPADY